MPTCTDCKEKKPKSEFYKDNGKKSGLYCHCKNCHKIRMNQRQTENKEHLVDAFGGKCTRCGYNKCIRALHFHHTDPSTKKFGVSSRLGSSFELLLKEAKKCILICGNCHIELHVKDYDIKRQKYTAAAIANRRISIPGPHFCIDCKTKIRSTCTRCKPCDNKFRLTQSRTKISWPTTNNLLKRLETMSYTKLGKELGVSDNAVRKRIKTHPTR